VYFGHSKQISGIRANKLLASETSHECDLEAGASFSGEPSVLLPPRNPFNEGMSFWNMQISVDFMQQVATNTHSGILYQGVAVHGSDRPSFSLEAPPHDGDNPLDEPVYWLLPGGQCVCWSARELARAKEIDFLQPQSKELYEYVAEQFGYTCLGMPDKSVLAEAQDPSNLAAGKWRSLFEKNVQPPANERAPCWWLIDEVEPPQLLCRDLATLILELRQHRVATVSRLCQEREKRLANNASAVEALNDLKHLWEGVAGGPSLELLKEPSFEMIELASKASSKLSSMLRENSLEKHMCFKDLSAEDQAAILERIQSSVSMLRSPSWLAMKQDRFTCTPPGVWEELVKAAQNRCARGARKTDWGCRARINSTAADPASDDSDFEGDGKDSPWKELSAENVTQCFKQDAPRDSGVDPDEFKKKMPEYQRKPHKWQEAVDLAGDVLVADMRVLLNMHYDSKHFDRTNKGRSGGGSLMRLNHRAMSAGTKHQQLELPASVREILQQPSDEDCWERLEKVRTAVLNEVQGAKTVPVLLEDGNVADEVATAIEANDGDCELDVLGRDVFDLHANNTVIIPCGSCVVGLQGVGSKKMLRKRLGELIRSQRSLTFHSRPLSSAKAMSLSVMGKALAGKDSLEKIAARWKPAPLDIAELLDEMLLVLWDALFFTACEKWTALGVANISAQRTNLLGHCFLKGIKQGKKPLQDGMCAYCGALLYGVQNDNSANSNKSNGPPINQRGQKQQANGLEDTSAQPPFLLSYSPYLLAKELPAVFEHDPTTNRLSLKPGRHEPWVRPVHSRQGVGKNTWLYCKDCRNRHFPTSRSCKGGHVPFRDKASQEEARDRFDPKYRWAEANTSDEQDLELNPGIANVGDVHWAEREELIATVTHQESREAKVCITDNLRQELGPKRMESLVNEACEVIELTDRRTATALRDCLLGAHAAEGAEEDAPKQEDDMNLEVNGGHMQGTAGSGRLEGSRLEGGRLELLDGVAAEEQHPHSPEELALEEAAAIEGALLLVADIDATDDEMPTRAEQAALAERTPERRPFPSIEEYRTQWAAKKAIHVRAVPGDFSRENLVPKPDPDLMQDVPWVPFEAVKSDEAQARLSVCRMLSNMEGTDNIEHRPHFAGKTGEVLFRRRNPLQIAATFACLLNKREGKFTGLSIAELAAWHECLSWLREEGNNKLLRLYGTTYENFAGACNSLHESKLSFRLLPMFFHNFVRSWGSCTVLLTTTTLALAAL
jgi:hypothetical protein